MLVLASAVGLDEGANNAGDAHSSKERRQPNGSDRSAIVHQQQKASDKGARKNLAEYAFKDGPIQIAFFQLVPVARLRFPSRHYSFRAVLNDMVEVIENRGWRERAGPSGHFNAPLQLLILLISSWSVRLWRSRASSWRLLHDASLGR